MSSGKELFRDHQEAEKINNINVKPKGQYLSPRNALVTLKEYSSQKQKNSFAAFFFKFPDQIISENKI